MSQNKTPQHIKLDERNHVEKPLLDQLSGLGWEIIDEFEPVNNPELPSFHGGAVGYFCYDTVRFSYWSSYHC